MGDERTIRIYDAAVLPPNIKISAASVIGTRKYQEDSIKYHVMPDGVLGVVCDGMGGLAHGERSSSCAVNSLLRYFSTVPREKSSMGHYWESALKLLDEEVAGLKDERGMALGAGTTIAAIFSDGKELTFASAGDSMIYLLRKGTFRRLVRPHNYQWMLEQKLNDNRISLIEYQSEMKKGEALITYLGMNGLEIWDCSKKPLLLEKGDRVLLCSDGLYKGLSLRKIQNIMEKYKKDEFEKTALELIKEIFNGPPRSLDNISILCFYFAG